MAKLIKNWGELSRVPPNDKYMIIVNMEFGGAWIKPRMEVPNGEWFKHNVYLSTHTFYGSNYKRSTEIFQKFGFDIEIDNWDKDKEE